MRYSGDPYRAKARYASTCPKCLKNIDKGESIIIWPRNPAGRKAHHERCSEADFQQSQAAFYDEAVMTGRW